MECGLFISRENPEMICTSLMCSNYGCDYCEQCSHAIFHGFGYDENGRYYRFEFSSYFGLTILNKDWFTISKKQPISEKHPFWKLFEQWYNKHQYKYMWE